MKKLSILCFLACFFFVAKAQINGYEIADIGYLTQPMETKSGIVASNNNFSEIYLVENNELKTLVRSRGCGLYAKVNKNKDLIGFKSINDAGKQAPAILDLTTQKVTLLENYTHQCGQVSFSDNGTVAYTMGNKLVVRNRNSRKEFDLGFYTNLTEISPDATKVAYTNADGEMFIINLNNAKSTQITANNMFNPKWSANGSKLAIHKIDGHIAVYDLQNKQTYNLGEGFNASWINNTDQLVYTALDKENEFIVNGSCIRKVNFDGKNNVALIASSADCPQDAVILSDNKMVVSYIAGAKKGLRKMTVTPNNNLKYFSANAEETLVAITPESKVGYRFASAKGLTVSLDTQKLEKPKVMAGNIGILDIPYINQVWDTPPTPEGCTRYGYVACAPSSCCMLLGYYGLLDKHPIESRKGGVGIVDYSWYVGRDYISKTGFNFNIHASGNGCDNVGGAYGYMWGISSPASTMHNFYKNNGVTEAFFENSWTAFDREVSNGYPYTICLKNSTNGHVVLGFRTNSEVRNKQVQPRQGSFICHDPYGDYNEANYPNWDGRYSTYDWPGFNNGWANINVFYWGCVARHKVTSSIISPSQAQVSFGDVVKNQSVTIETSIKSTNVTKPIKVRSNAPAFTVTPNTLPAEGGKIKITFTPRALNKYEGTISLISEGCNTASIAVDGKGILKEFTLTGGWNFSKNNGLNATALTWLAADKLGAIRNMDFGAGKLYVTFENKRVLVIDARTGALKGELNNSGVEGGVIPLADCKYVDGKVIASNICTSTASPLKVYVWDNDNATPRVLLSTTNFGTGVSRIGDCIGFHGDVNNGCLYFACNVNNEKTVLVKYAISNGVCETTPETIELKNKSNKNLYFGISPRITVEESGKFWCNGAAEMPNLFDENGKWITNLNPAVTENNKGGNAFQTLKYNGIEYGFTTCYTNASETFTNCSFTAFNAIEGWAKAVAVGGKYPENGLGDARNINCATSLAVNPNGNEGFEVWVMAQSQGLAYYSYGTVKEYPEAGVESVIGERNCLIHVANHTLEIVGVQTVSTEIYSVYGKMALRVDNENQIDVNTLSSGIYVVVVYDEFGNRYVSKVVL